MTEELHSLQLISPGVLRIDSPPRTELVLDWDAGVALAGVVVMVAIVVGRRRAHR